MRQTMGMFSLSWNTYKQNIFNGLASLQQNGEFVDMTLAADGHHVKVHQLVMSLLSPYIKELISSTQCPHPVIFLNKVSYPVLCSILEYAYTGEVLVSKDHLPDLIVAAKELRIKGLEDMKIDEPTMKLHDEQNNVTNTSTSLASFSMDYKSTPSPEFVLADDTPLQADDLSFTSDNEGLNSSNNEQPRYTHSTNKILKPDKICNTGNETKSTQLPSGTQFQYSLTNQGSLQLILNRFLYYLRYTCKRNAGAGQDMQRRWRCVDYIGRYKCSATLITKDNIVMKRYGVHSHPFHDKRILNKVRNKSVFSAISDAEKEAKAVKCIRQHTKKDVKK